MKIAIYVHSWPPGASADGANGIVTYAAQLVPALRQLGHEVFVLTANPSARIVDEHTIDLNDILLPRPLYSRLKSLLFKKYHPFGERLRLAIIALAQRHRLDIVEIEETHGWGSQIAQTKIVPVVVRLHGPWFLNGTFDNSDKSEYRSRVYREGRAISSATLVTAPSANVLDNVRTYYNVRLKLARVIHNPFSVDGDVPQWEPNVCDQNRILYVGRFDRRKGGDLMLRAFAGLSELYPDLRLSFVGPDDGVCEDGVQLSFDEFVSKNLTASCRSRIDFYGKLSHQNVMALRNEHFLTIVASQFEILPYAVIEAMSLGCPIVASNVGGIPELITNRKNGILFRSQDVGDLISACRTLLDNHVLASSLGSQARKDCLELFSASRVATQTISAYQTAIKIFHSGSSRGAI
jgi:glycosyltransferase involved in cell wall biosynthesis